MNIDDIIRENRFTISVVFPLMGAFLLLASFEGILPDIISYNPYLIIFGTLVMRSPLIAGLLPLSDRKLLTGVLILTLYSFIIEYIGTTTGLPYGSFEYVIELGPMILGKVPLGLPIFFIPLVLNAYMLVTLLYPAETKRFVPRIFGTVTTVLIIDLVLDPGAVAIRFWEYESGIYYGVPLMNYLGWILSASVAVILMDWSIDRSELIDRLENCEFMLDDMVSFVFLWGAINLYFSQWIPFIIAVLLGLMLFRTERFDMISVKNSRISKLFDKPVS